MLDIITTRDLFFLVSSMAVTVVSLALFVKILDDRKKHRYTEYDMENKRVVLDDSRKYFESKIYQLENELQANQKRWESVNHLILDSQQNTIIDPSNNNLNLTSFFINAGITKEDLVIEKDLVFMLTPFHPEKYSIMSKVKEICSEVGLRCIRGDEEHVTSSILTHILKMVLKSRLVIVNIDGRNPNVFYELGICHAIGKPLIIISKTDEKIPFDITAMNIIFYSNEDELTNKLSKALLRILI